MGEIIKVKGKVIGKWIKGIIFKKPMLSVDLFEGILKVRYVDYPTSMAYWHAVEIGHIIIIKFEQDLDDGLWYPV